MYNAIGAPFKKHLKFKSNEELTKKIYEALDRTLVSPY